MNKKTQKKLLNIVKDNYEEIAKDFSSTRYALWPELKKIINSVIASPKSSGRSNPVEIATLSASASWRRRIARNDMINILDLGCGNGRLFELFKNKNVNYFGIDQSHNLIKLAKQKYPEAKFRQGAILKLEEIINKKFDLILLIAVLPHIPSYKLRLRFLKNLKNYAQPKGNLILTCWDLHASAKHKKIILKNNLKKLIGLNSMDFNDILFSGFNKKTPRYYHAFKIKELKTLLIKSGWRVVKIYSDKKNIYAICV